MEWRQLNCRQCCHGQHYNVCMADKGMGMGMGMVLVSGISKAATRGLAWMVVGVYGSMVPMSRGLCMCTCTANDNSSPKSTNANDMSGIIINGGLQGAPVAAGREGARGGCWTTAAKGCLSQRHGQLQDVVCRDAAVATRT